MPWSSGGGLGTWGHLLRVLMGARSMLEHGPAPRAGGQWSQLLGGALSHRYGALTFGNVQKSIPASFGARAPATVRKIAVRRTAQVGLRCTPWQLGDGWAAAAVAQVGRSG